MEAVGPHQMLLIYSNASNLLKSWKKIFNSLKFDEGCWNSLLILVHIQEAIILPLGSVYFAFRGKKECQDSFNKAFAIGAL